MNEEREIRMARAVAPEDICEGDYLAVLNVVDEVLPLIEPTEAWNAPKAKSIEPLRVLCLPCSDSVPLKVEAVCLPFVLVKAPAPQLLSLFGGGNASPSTLLRTIDVRRCRLARLPEEYGKRVYRLLKGRAERKGGAPATGEDDS